MKSIIEIRRVVTSSLDEFVKWPKEALLLWHGCTKTKSHNYPSRILDLLREQSINRRNFSNDPAIHAFLVAGGERPTRRHKNSGWDIHHLYFGLPTRGGRNAIHAVKDGVHFTQSAGLVAVHPIAHALCGEDPEFTEILRKKSFDLFGYDPDGLFTSQPCDEFGFIPPHKPRIIYAPTN